MVYSPLKFWRSTVQLPLFCALMGVAGAIDSGQPARMDFDSIRVGNTVRRELSIINESDKVLAVKDANSSCSCLRVIGTPRTVGPKAEGKIAVEYTPVNEGHADVELLVETDRAGDPVIAFRWVGEVAPAGPDAGAIRDREADGVLISADELAGQKEKGGLMIIDIRDSGKFNLCHIAGAVNWPWTMLKNFGSLKKRRIVIHGSGSDDGAVVREALGLMQAGFESVHVLRGGVRAWMLAKFPVLGPGVESARAGFVEAADFFSSSQDDWLVFQLEGADGSADGRLPGTVAFRADTDHPAIFAAELRSKLALSPRVSKILFISGEGERYEAIEKNLRAGFRVPIFYLDGGDRAYRRLVAQRSAMLDRRELKLISTGPGDGRLPNGLVPGGGNGCGSCPKKTLQK